MMRLILIALLLPCLSILSCNAQTGTNNPQTPPVTVKAVPPADSKPVYKQVIFFALSSSELVALESKDPSAVEATNDFDFHVNEFMNDPGRTDLDISYKDQEQIFLMTGSEEILFERSKQAEPFGIILTDGIKAPLIKSGIYAREQYIQMCNEYFSK